MPDSLLKQNNVIQFRVGSFKCLQSSQFIQQSALEAYTRLNKTADKTSSEVKTTHTGCISRQRCLQRKVYGTTKED